MELKKKEFTYRGKTIEELKKLDVREFAKYLRSREKRNVLRQFQKIETFIERSKKKIRNKKSVRTHQRDLVDVPEMVGMRIQIYNGKDFISVDIIRAML